jgi:hypothetical protein
MKVMDVVRRYLLAIWQKEIGEEGIQVNSGCFERLWQLQ